MEKRSLFIVSGEESGDLHGASLMKALRKMAPSLEFSGMGGHRMREAGLKGLDSKEVSVVGLVEVVEKLPQILRSFKALRALLLSKRFEAVVLIDFPDFNLRFAKEAKAAGVPVIYYISPQVWAWRKGRIKKIARLVKKMLVVFPFEVGLYKDAGVDVEYVGHPLADTAECALTKEAARTALGVDRGATCVALLPGSRGGEVKRILPLLLKAGGLIEKGFKDKPVFLLPAAGGIDDVLLNGFLKDSPVEVKVIRGQMYPALRASDAAVVASGTATLETALIGTPMVIVYKMSPLSYGVAKALVRLDHAGLPNIIAGRQAVPELLQGNASPQNVAREVLQILTVEKTRSEILKAYKEIRLSLGNRGAAEKAAKAVLRVMEA